MWKTHTFGVKVFLGEKQFSFIVSSGTYGYFKLLSHHSLLVSTPCPGMPTSSLSKRHCQLYILEMLLPLCHFPSRALSLALRTLHNLSPNHLPTWVLSTPLSQFTLNGLLTNTCAAWRVSCKKQSLIHCCLQLMGKCMGNTEARTASQQPWGFAWHIGLPEKIPHRGHTYSKSHLLLVGYSIWTEYHIVFCVMSLLLFRFLCQELTA